MAAVCLATGLATLSCSPSAMQEPPPRSPASIPFTPEAAPAPSWGMAEEVAPQARADSSPGHDAFEGEERCPARAGRMTVRRSALSHTLDAGLGHWLRGVEVEPKVDRGRFQGWLVRGLFTGDPCWDDVGLQAGDVVHRVNHHAIEKPEEAQAVWTGLRSAPEISVEFVRGGRLETLTFSVVNDGVPRPRQ